MGTLVFLEGARRRRAARWRSIAVHAAMHPALRWLSATDDLAHRRLVDGLSPCGAPLLVLADGDIELCPDCYPGPAA